MQKAWKTVQVAGGPDLLVALAAGNLWSVWVGWPALVEGRLDLLTAALSLAAGAVLWWGLRTLWSEGDDARGRWDVSDAFRGDRGAAGLTMLLLGVPALLAITLARRNEALNQAAFDPALTIVAAISLYAYGAVVLWRTTPTWRKPIGTSMPLGSQAWLVQETRWERLRRRLLVGTFTAGAAAVGLVAPRAGGYEPLVDAWGEAAVDGAQLTAVLAGSLAVPLLGLFLADALRPRRLPPSPPGRELVRAMGFLALASLGAATYWLIGSR